MPVNEAVWALEPHSVGKHHLLRGYLPLWLKILGTWHGDLVLYDGFAGPGEYKDGEEGSPIIMLRAAEGYIRQKPEARVHCTFVENRRDRFEHLGRLISDLSLPSNINVRCLQGEFAAEVPETLRSIARHQNDVGPVPSFFMIDPFGIKGVPFSVFRGLLALEKSECLFTFMWDAILRYREHPSFEEYMLELFEDSEWRGLSSEKPQEYIYSRFEQLLRDAGAKYVLVFDLWKEGRHIYSLFFATKGYKGLRYYETGYLEESILRGLTPSAGSKPGQSRLDIPAAHTGLRDDLRAEFGFDWVSVEQSEEFVQGDRTRFHSGHLKRETLFPLEREGVIEVKRPDGVRMFPTGKGIQFRFLEIPKPPIRQEALRLL